MTSAHQREAFTAYAAVQAVVRSLGEATGVFLRSPSAWVATLPASKIGRLIGRRPGLIDIIDGARGATGS